MNDSDITTRARAVLYPLTGSMGDENHTSEMVAARVADQRARYSIGMVVRRNDFGEGTGPFIRITSMQEPTCGGYIYAHGDHVSEWSEGGIDYSTGPLHKCTPVPWVVADRREIRESIANAYASRRLLTAEGGA